MSSCRRPFFGKLSPSARAAPGHTPPPSSPSTSRVDVDVSVVGPQVTLSRSRPIQTTFVRHALRLFSLFAFAFAFGGPLFQRSFRSRLPASASSWPPSKRSLSLVRRTALSRKCGFFDPLTLRRSVAQSLSRPSFPPSPRLQVPFVACARSFFVSFCSRLVAYGAEFPCNSPCRPPPRPGMPHAAWPFYSQVPGTERQASPFPVSRPPCPISIIPIYCPLPAPLLRPVRMLLSVIVNGPAA